MSLRTTKVMTISDNAMLLFKFLCHFDRSKAEWRNLGFQRLHCATTRYDTMLLNNKAFSNI